MIHLVQSLLIDRPFYDHKARQCPYVLALSASNGGSMIERCSLPEHHDGPHAITFSGPLETDHPVTIVHIEWATVPYVFSSEVQRKWHEDRSEGKALRKGLIPKQGLQERKT